MTDMIRVLRNMVAAIALTAVCLAGGAAQAEPPVYTDLVYGSNELNLLDLYLPEGVENAPVVVFIHGGGWLGGDKADPPALQEFLAEGIAVASIDYRFSTIAKWPAQLEDVEIALAYLRENAGQYGYDGSRIAVLGSSAGAHLAAWAALALAGDDETRLAAAVVISAPTDLYALIDDNDVVDLSDDNPVSKLLGAPVEPASKPLADAASPAVYAAALPSGAPLPAFLIMHGTEDRVISPRQAHRLYAALQINGGAPRVELAIVRDAAHGVEKFNDQMPRVIRFISREFRTARPSEDNVINPTDNGDLENGRQP